MGASGSKLGVFKSDAITGAQYRDSIQATDLKNMADALFQFMYSKWEVRDIFDIAENPGDYVIAVSDLITTQFHVLGYTTKRNKIGEIYFEKWEDLDPPKSSSELSALQGKNTTRSARLSSKLKRMTNKYGPSAVTRAETGQKIHEQNARIISFYFVRLFQILGSLLLVIKDDRGFPNISPQTGTLVSDKMNNSARAFTNQGYKVLPVFKPQGQKGGSESSFSSRTPLGIYEFLRYYLRSYDDDEIKKYQDDYNLSLPQNLYKLAGSEILFFEYTAPKEIPDSIFVNPGTQGTEKEKQTFKIFLKSARSEKPILESLDIYITRFETDTGTVLHGYEPPSKFSQSYERYQRYPREVSIIIRTSSKSNIGNATFIKAENYKPENSYINGIQYRLKEGSIFAAVEGEFDLTKDFVKILERLVIQSLRKLRPGEDFVKPVLTKKDNMYKNPESKLKDAHKSNPGLYAIFNELNNKNNSPHCVARALDLLDAASINNIRKDINGNDILATTRICNPSVKEKITEYIPLKTVGQLFGKLKVSSVINVNEEEFKKALVILDAFVNKTESKLVDVDELKTIGQESEAADLSAAIVRLTKAFHANKENTDVKRFQDIDLSKPSKCGSSGVISVQSGGPQYIELQRHAKMLLAYHLNNVIDITKFLKSVFNISQRADGSWKVEGPKTEILFAGFNVLDSLTDQARALLVNYYSGCEEIYQRGVKTWMDRDITEVKEPIK
jgi:hypothetical protein